MKRTKVDFSNHEVVITYSDGLLIHHLKKPNTIIHNVKFINTNGILAVTGDFGNWIFCREFHPSKDGYVSGGYWEEKLCICSTQEPKEFDEDSTNAELESMINGGAAEYGWEGKKLEEAIEYYKDCLQKTDDFLEYKYFAYREHPSFMDYENVVCIKKTKEWLNAVFDAFDEICSRIN